MIRTVHSIWILLLSGTLILPPGWCCIHSNRFLHQVVAAKSELTIADSVCPVCCKAKAVGSAGEDLKHGSQIKSLGSEKIRSE